MNILFIADIFAKAGRNAVLQLLPGIKEEYDIEFTIANGENVAGGYGITPNLGRKLLRYGIDVLTSGNHIWDRKDDVQDWLDTSSQILRPFNYPPSLPGSGSNIYTTERGNKIAVLNLQGRAFMASIDCPFRTGEMEVKNLKASTPNIIIDFHAETTAEKKALGYYFDGKVSAVIGTHTHIQTADECILPNGTAYITDVGMTGPFDSVIGMRKKGAIERIITQTKVKFAPAEKDVHLSGAVIEINSANGKALSIQRLCLKIPDHTSLDQKED
ncbi:TIGR00282 family metallophosphoesterase [bacterium]|nr:TIGR00282 family metallophosphoesterase [bacterium]